MTVQVKQFTPPSIQNYNLLHPKYAHRFVDKNPNNRRGDRLQYWLNQGWEIAPYGNAGMQGNRKTGASSPDGAVHYRGLVLVRIPVAQAQARNAHYREKHRRLIEASSALRELGPLAKKGKTRTGHAGASAFAEARITREGQVLEHSTADTLRREQALQNVDPAALKELQDRMEQIAAANEEKDRRIAALEAERQERLKKPSERKRKSFPTS